MNRIVFHGAKTVYDLKGDIYVKDGYIHDRKCSLYPVALRGDLLEQLVLFCWEYNEWYHKSQEALEYRVFDGHAQVLFCGQWLRPTKKVLSLMKPHQRECYSHLVESTLSQEKENQ